ncbi:MAG: helix-turn-helix domain-containing protein [Gammaproteobacteria bacterium]|nr:helix-turn-helix domain-containing protein [Gammaproteobacteria bacterium]
MQKQLRQCLFDYFDAWNRSDIKAVAAFFSDDAVYVDTAMGREYRGDEIEKYISDIVSSSKGLLKFSIVKEPVINGDVVFLQSSLKIKSGPEEQQLESAELIKFDGKQIVMIQTYYNLDEQLESLLLERDKYAKSGLNRSQINNIKNRLDNMMQKDEPYRNSELKLQDLSELLNIRRNHLSQILNLEYQMKFFDFINHYRLQAFLKSLHSKPVSEINITELAYDAGFSSSSVFYKIFKRYQDISPGQYIKNIK